MSQLLADGYHPILFCRFIPTAEYVAEELRPALPKAWRWRPSPARCRPPNASSASPRWAQHRARVLVATDCLSEGINLQEHFNAVVHYDLSWNPTRHEQREGRVDRYGQPSATVRTVTYYGVDNQIDGIVLEVLLRKHRTIRRSLGISVPVPANTGEVVQALMQGLMLRGSQMDQRQLALRLRRRAGHDRRPARPWDDVTEKEKRSRTMFAQRAIGVEEVAQDWQAVRAAIGAGVDVRRFVTDRACAPTRASPWTRTAGWRCTLPNQAALHRGRRRPRALQRPL